MGRHLTRGSLQRLILYACGLGSTVAAWRWLAGATLGAPHPGHGETHSFLYAVGMWQAMIVAMMTPTVLPWIAAFAKLSLPASGRWPFGPVTAFTGGYFLVWLGYSVSAAALQLLVQQAGWMTDGRVTAPLAGAVLVASGVSQFVPLRQACLSHCRNPLTYFLARWRDGPAGGFRMGAVHGAFCLGCCWMIMLSGFALGVMNLAWMAVLTAMVCLEQLAPNGVWLGRAFGAGLAVWGLVLLMWLAAAGSLV